MTQSEQGRRGIGPYVKSLMDTHEPPLSQGDLAAKLRIHQSTASRKLSGERGFDLHELVPVAELVGVPVVQLLTDGLNPTAEIIPAQRVSRGKRAAHPLRRSTDTADASKGTTGR